LINPLSTICIRLVAVTILVIEAIQPEEFELKDGESAAKLIRPAAPSYRIPVSD
jgi:hypothetical protein